eukprot:COSAG01_NODE_7834_length_3034_cov_60.185690_2_plen_399_part_00
MRKSSEAGFFVAGLALGVALVSIVSYLRQDEVVMQQGVQKRSLIAPASPCPPPPACPACRACRACPVCPTCPSLPAKVEDKPRKAELSPAQIRAAALGSGQMQQLQRGFGPLRFGVMTLAPKKCKSFEMAFPRQGKAITVNTDVWDQVLRTPNFRWKFPPEEGYAVDAIFERCMPENGKTPLVLDAGANMGYFSLAAAACGCDAIAYEPNANCQKFIGASIALNGYGSVVKQRRVAVTDVNQPISFNGWGTATNEDKRKAIAAGTAVQGIKLDEDVRAMSDSHYILYLKVDIQGSEHDALRGTRSLLSQKKIRFVAFEAQLKTQLASVQDAFGQVCGHGYRCFDVQNPRVDIVCPAGLAAYRDSACKAGDRMCERYLMCAHESSQLQMVRDHVAKNQH